MRKRRSLAPWCALIAFLAVPPFVWPHSWLLAYLAQSATMIVFALSYNLLLGETGLLSFGHAAYAGLGALIAARVFNAGGMPLVVLPLVGGIGGALCGVLFGFIATRRSGTAFAMITLGLGELVVAAAWTLPGWFGGDAGVAIDRASGPRFVSSIAGWSFGPAREAYALIALWCVVATVAMCALSRTPFMRVANAVRDNPVRAAAIGCYPSRVRYGVVVLSAFFAGIAGTLGLINLELVSTESVGMMRSGAVLIATVIGGTSAFFGPVAGAVVGSPVSARGTLRVSRSMAGGVAGGLICGARRGCCCGSRLSCSPCNGLTRRSSARMRARRWVRSLEPAAVGWMPVARLCCRRCGLRCCSAH